MMQAEEFAARVAIAHLQSTYAITADASDWDAMESIWAQDAVVLPPGGQRIAGKAAIMARFRAIGRHRATTPHIFTRHNMTSSLVTFDNANQARGRSYFLVNSVAGFDHCGTYTDIYRLIDGIWLLAERKTRLDHVAPTSQFPALREAMEADQARGDDDGA